MNRKKILRFIVLFSISILVSIGFLYAQSYPLKHYSSKDGLTYFVTGMFQDYEGFLWVGTEHGLFRFDGIEFKNVLTGVDEVKDDVIIDLLEDRGGNLWIGSRGGGLICIKKNEIKTYTTKDGLPSNRILAVSEDREGNLWLGTRAGISRFDGRDFLNYSKEDGLVDDFVLDIVHDKEGNSWIGTANGLSYFTKKGGKRKGEFINYKTDSGLASNYIYKLMMDRKGNVWICTQEGISYCPKEKKTGRPAFISYSTKDGMLDNVVYSIMEAGNGDIWIGTDSGVSRFSPSKGEFTNYYGKNGFPQAKVLSILQDREGNIWFGTSAGVSRLHSLAAANFSTKNGLPNNSVWSIIEERRGKYWIGTDNGLSCYDNGRFTTYTTEDGLINDSIFNLLKDRGGNIWIATNGGLSVYSPITGKFANYSTADGLPGEVVISLAEDGNGTIWIGTQTGLFRFINGRIAPAPFNVKLAPLPIHAILPDSKGNLWFSDTRGLRKMSLPVEPSAGYDFYSVEEGLIHNDISFLFEDSRGRIWIGTQRGLSCFSGGKFTNYTTAHGLVNNVCKFALEDGSGNLWIGTANGISRFDGKSFKTYTSRDGLISDGMREGACLKDSRGDLWFGTVRGITRFDPQLDRDNTVPPPVYINHFSVWGRDYPLSDDISLKYDQNYLRLGYVGLCYTSPEDVVYKYRLEGIDREWLESGNREISYTSLDPKEYVFKVIAVNNDGVESLKPAEIRFRILPPFWQTWWFRVLAGLVVFSAAVLLVLFKFRRMKEKMASEAKSKQLVMAQRMKLLGILAGGAVHDLKNLLGIIIGYSDLAVEYVDEEEVEVKTEAIEMIKSTAGTAFQVVKQMLAFTRQPDDEITASNLAELMEELLDILKVSVPKAIKILWKPPEEEVMLHINPVKFKQVVLNLCLNAVQAMPGKGELKIALFKYPQGENQVLLEVSDTGTGISPEIQDKIFEPLFTTKEEEKGAGLGLFVVKQIVDEYGGEIRLRSRMAGGTTFRIFFPVHKPPAKEPVVN